MPYHTFKRPPNSSNLCDQYVSENWNQNIDCKEFLQRLPSHKCHDLSFTICQELPRLSQTYMSVIKILVSYWAQKISIRNFLIDILQTMKFSRGRGASSVAGRSHIYKFISLFILLSSLDVEILMIINYLVGQRQSHHCLHQPDIIFVHFFTPPDFQDKIFSSQKSVICKIIHSRHNIVNVLNISNLVFFGSKWATK